jgi:hypothetical protein
MVTAHGLAHRNLLVTRRVALDWHGDVPWHPSRDAPPGAKACTPGDDHACTPLPDGRYHGNESSATGSDTERRCGRARGS